MCPKRNNAQGLQHNSTRVTPQTTARSALFFRNQLYNLRAELERAHRTIARQTIQLDYHDTLHDYLRTELGVDVKKAESACKSSSGSVSGSASKIDSL